MILTFESQIVSTSTVLHYCYILSLKIVIFFLQTEIYFVPECNFSKYFRMVFSCI